MKKVLLIAGLIAFGVTDVVVLWLVAGSNHPVASGTGAPIARKKSKIREAPDANVFGIAKIWQLHLEVAADQYAKIQPAGGMPFFGGPGGAPQAAAKPGEEEVDRHKGGSFGIEFPWVRTDLTAEGTTYKNLGLRYKGGGSYMPSAGKLQRNFKVELDHYDKDQAFHGMKSLNLNAGAADPTRFREALSFAVFRAAGVPASRTAYAEVTLSVPGKFDNEYVGLYTLIEQVDRRFLKERFANDKGLLMKPERRPGTQGGPFEYLGDDWERYKAACVPKHEPTKEEAQRVIEFAKLINKADDEQFRSAIGGYLDVDEFLRFLAVTALLSDMDSVFTIGHNVYIYLNPETNKFVFIPWDKDLSFGGFFMFGSAEQQAEMSLTHPYAGDFKLVDRLLADKEISEKYHNLIAELSRTCFSKDRLLQDLDAIEGATKESLAKEKKASEARKERAGGFGFGPPGGFGGTLDLRTFIDKRTSSVAAQLAGTSKGYTPKMGFGFGPPGGPGGRPGGRGGQGGPGGGPGGPGGFGRGGPGFGGGPDVGLGPGMFWAKQVLEALDTNKDGKVTKDELVAAAKKYFAEWDKDKKGKLGESAIAERLRQWIPPPPDFGPRGGPRGPDGAAVLASGIVKRADADKDGKVTLDEFVAAAEALFKECDKDKNGSLNEQEIAAAINSFFPQPNFGPPGGGFPDGPGRQPEQGGKEGRP